MRKNLLVWLVGLAGLSSLTGCILNRDCCGCCDGDGLFAHRRAAARRSTTTTVVREESRPTPSYPTKLPQPVLLPKVVESTEPPARNRVEHPRVEKIDVTSQESEILRRELAMQKSKSPARVEETTRVEPVPTVVPSTKQTVEPIVAIPHPPMKPAAEPVVVVSESDVPMTRSAASDKEKTVALKSMDIHYGQADTFKSITGQVQLYRKTWRLRYADVGQEDSYGGVVVLEGSADLSKLRDGCHIRVTGVLVPPATRTGLAMYRVQSLEILD